MDEIQVSDWKQIVDAKNTNPPKGMVFPMFIGKTESGEERHIDLNHSPHMLVAGMTGGGKSNFVEHCICTWLKRGNCDLYIIDRVDYLYGYEAHKNVTYITKIDHAKEAIKKVSDEIEKRAKLFRKTKGVRNFSDWKGEGCPKRIFIIIDEYSHFSEDNELIGLK